MPVFKIMHRSSAAVVAEIEGVNLPSALVAAVARKFPFNGAELCGACLIEANLADAKLFWADLTDAGLAHANLADAWLGEVDLVRAHLVGANLAGAWLSNANLTGADLTGADLTGAYIERTRLGGAKLDGAILPAGVTFEHFRDVVVPKLLTANGKTVEEVVATGCWNCHELETSPMHVVFGVDDFDDIPDGWKLHATAFIALFDGGHLPEPAVS